MVTALSNYIKQMLIALIILISLVGGCAETTPAPPPPPKQWTEVITISGSTDKRSQLFELTGAEARLNWTVEGEDPFVFVAIYVLEEGTSLEREGGFSEVIVGESGSDTTFLVKEPGRYYIEVLAANADWTVTIEEFR